MPEIQGNFLKKNEERAISPKEIALPQERASVEFETEKPSI